MSTKTVLFLCSGNYYRSRFAEVLFNHLADQSQVPWLAQSRGLRINSSNEGEISIHAVEALNSRGIRIAENIRFPIVAEEQDFEMANRIIALKEAEHRPMVMERFPRWIESVEFWSIHDIDCATPKSALTELEVKVRALHDCLVS